MSYILGHQIHISILTKKFCLLKEEKEKDYIKNEIIKESLDFIQKIIKISSENNKINPLFSTDYFKSCFIELFSILSYFYFNNKESSSLNSVLKEFEKVSEKYKIDEKCSNFYLVNKVKGDLNFLIQNYKEAENYYIIEIKLMNDNNFK